MKLAPYAAFTVGSSPGVSCPRPPAEEGGRCQNQKVGRRESTRGTAAVSIHTFAHLEKGWRVKHAVGGGGGREKR